MCGVHGRRYVWVAGHMYRTPTKATVRDTEAATRLLHGRASTRVWADTGKEMT